MSSTAHVLHGLERELDWLRQSGVQSAQGGLHAWVNEDTGSRGPLYPEVTGYFISLCVDLARHDRRRGWLGRAEGAAGWLLEHGIDASGAVLGRLYEPADSGQGDPFSATTGRVRLLDCAVVGSGLIALYEATADPRWLEAAIRIGDFALNVFESPDRQRRYAAYDLAKKEPVPGGPEWYGHHGPQHLKALAFFDVLSRYHRTVDCAELVDRTLEAALASQGADGRFPTSDNGAATHLHPHFYAVEGLLHLVAVRGRASLVDPAARAVGWAFRTCLLGEPQLQRWSCEPGGSLEGWRSDAVAQGLRAYHALKLLEPDRAWPWEHRLGEVSSGLEMFRTPSGGTSLGLDHDTPSARRANAWAHFFRIQAKLFASQRQAGPTFDPAHFVLV